MSRYSVLVGIDEAGRGPLAGPVAVGAVAVPRAFSTKFWKGIRDSKKLSEKAREEWFAKIKKAHGEELLRYKVSMIGPRTIDRVGITRAVRRGIRSCLKRLDILPGRAQILLDGSLKAPKKFPHQETIIGGDDSISIISAAAVVAKVCRDRRMDRLEQKYPRYNFKINKGYGTSAHIRALKKYGLCRIHRRSFLNNVIK